MEKIITELAKNIVELVKELKLGHAPRFYILATLVAIAMVGSIIKSVLIGKI